MNQSNLSNVSVEVPQRLTSASQAREMPGWGEWIVHPPAWFVALVLLVCVAVLVIAGVRLLRDPAILGEPGIRRDILLNVLTLVFAGVLAGFLIELVSFYLAVFSGGVGGWLVAHAVIRLDGVRRNLVSTGETWGEEE